MVQRIAASLGLLAFAVCLLAGGFGAGNSFSTTVVRAMLALAATYAIGLLVGVAVQRMLEENLRLEEERLRKSTETESEDR